MRARVRVHPRMYILGKLRTNIEMYELFKILEPELAQQCHLSTFLALRPFYIVPPTRRTCTCTYHNEVRVILGRRRKRTGNSPPSQAKMFMEDAKKAHEKLHEHCGTPQGCQCSMCKEGKCKDSELYDDYHNMQREVCCPVGEGEDFKYECAKGTCAECGWYEKLEFDVPRGLSLKVLCLVTLTLTLT